MQQDASTNVIDFTERLGAKALAAKKAAYESAKPRATIAQKNLASAIAIKSTKWNKPKHGDRIKRGAYAAALVCVVG